MSTFDTLGATEEVVGPDSTQHLYRVAGLGAVGAVVAWLGQPVVVTLAAGRDGGGEVTDWAGVESARWSGAVEILIFSAMGVGMLFFVIGTWRLIRGRLTEVSAAAQVGLAGGAVGAGAWFLTAAESFRTYTSIGAGIPDAVPEPALQRAVMEGTALDITGAIILFEIGWTAWLVLLATVGRRVGVVPVAVVALIGLSAAGVLVQLAVPFLPPWPLVGYLLSMFVLGVVFLSRSRR